MFEIPSFQNTLFRLFQNICGQVAAGPLLVWGQVSEVMFFSRRHSEKKKKGDVYLK